MARVLASELITAGRFTKLLTLREHRLRQGEIAAHKAAVKKKEQKAQAG